MAIGHTIGLFWEHRLRRNQSPANVPNFAGSWAS